MTNYKVVKTSIDKVQNPFYSKMVKVFNSRSKKEHTAFILSKDESLADMISGSNVKRIKIA